MIEYLPTAELSFKTPCWIQRKSSIEPVEVNVKFCINDVVFGTFVM